MTYEKPLFSDKYLHTKFKQLELFKIENLDQKRDNILRWQKSIRNHSILQSTEESLQGSFLQQLFVEILQYSNQKDSGEWFLETEQKTLDNKKMDAALGFFKIENKTIQADIRVVIELKNANTDLDKAQNRKDDKRTPVQQAFDYANSLGGSCRWIIVSNFKEIRLYYQTDRTRYQQFDILNLHKEDEFKKFYFLLTKTRLISAEGDSITDKLYFERQAEELAISKNFYADYKQARLDFFQSLKAYNPAIDELLLLNKTQKMLDRLIFVHFCEDYNIIDSYTLRNLIDNVRRDLFVKEKDKIYRRMQVLFEAVNEGYPLLNINKFNGGLFAEDTVLNSLKVDDAILEPILKLVEYDLASDLGVNILGHIFEQSISDIEELKAAIVGEVFDKKQGKRKKDGIYYTPDTITRYIVEEAIGGWLKEQRLKLNEAVLPELTEQDLAASRIVERGKNKGKFECNAAVQAHLDFYEAYKLVLEQIKVLDPACGSGAFLNQAFDFLYQEGKRVNEKLAQLRGGQFSALDLGKQILENNLFGVDLNQESVEITKLSLWIKTANRYRELTSLDNTIKCGNSLIDDVAVAGEKAFVWESEFKSVMQKGGFDIVIGNPPYGAKFSNMDVNFFNNFYKTFEYQVNSYALFYERGVSLLKDNGFLGYITPATFTYQHYFGKLRELLLKYQTERVIKYEYEVFAEANIGNSVVWILKKTENRKDYFYLSIKDKIELKPSTYFTKFDYDEIVSSSGIYKLDKPGINYKNIFNRAVSLGSVVNITVGIKPYQIGKGIPKQTEEIVKSKIFTSDRKINESYVNCINGKDFNRYRYLCQPSMWLSYGKWLAEPRDSVPFFSSEKIIIRQTSDSLIAHYDIENKINLNNVYNIWNTKENINLKYILVILNSKLLNNIYQYMAQEKGRLFAEVKKVTLEKLPLVLAPLDKQEPFIEKADIMLNQNQALQQQISAFLNFLQAELNPQKISSKLQHYYQLNWTEFKTELKKAKVDLNKLNLSEREQWLEKFETEKQKASAIKNLIEQTDNQIDAMVYALYGLQEQEIAIINQAI